MQDTLGALRYSSAPEVSYKINESRRLLDFFTIVFLIEALLKILAMGFFFPYDAYLSDGWNKLDFVVVIVSVMGLGGGGGGASGVGKILRVGRILRPLRMINRNEGMKVIVDALLRSLPAVGYTVILLAEYLFLFALVLSCFYA